VENGKGGREWEGTGGERREDGKREGLCSSKNSLKYALRPMTACGFKITKRNQKPMSVNAKRRCHSSAERMTSRTVCH